MAVTAAADATVAPPSPMRRRAQLLTDIVEPKNVIIVICLLIGVGRYGAAGIGWALLCITFSAVLPVLFIVHVVRKKGGGWAQRHLTEMQVRLAVIPVILAMVSVGVALLGLLGAPREMLALQLAMLATLLMVDVVSRTAQWKISGHTSVSAGAVVMAAVAFGPWWLLGLLGVAPVAWSRVYLHEHTRGQVLCGALLGVSVAGPVFALMR